VPRLSHVLQPVSAPLKSRICGMSDRRIGEWVKYRGRWYEVFGVSPMSVEPEHLILHDPVTRVYVVAEPREIAPEPGPPRRARRWALRRFRRG
jgi:hypothetical protein